MSSRSIDSFIKNRAPGGKISLSPCFSGAKQGFQGKNVVKTVKNNASTLPGHEKRVPPEKGGGEMLRPDFREKEKRFPCKSNISVWKTGFLLIFFGETAIKIMRIR